jgi:hypothetical protein
MKKNFLVTIPLLAVSALTAQMAHAAQKTDLTLQGQFVPTTCDISIANNGTWALGDIPMNDLNATGMTDLSSTIPQANRVTIDCASDAAIGVRLIDSRTGTASQEAVPATFPYNHQVRMYGLGTIDGKPVGKLAFHSGTNRPMVDGVERTVIHNDYIGGAWNNTATPYPFLGNGTYQRSWAVDSSTRTPMAARNISFDIYAAVAITDKSNLPKDKPIDVDGSASLEIMYY